MKLSLVIPCYNEESTLQSVVEKTLQLKTADLDLELIIVDDCSTDRSVDIAEQFSKVHGEVVLCRQDRNCGKGAALRAGFVKATGDWVGIQDADLEYDPCDYPNMLRLGELINADVVFGSRYLFGGGRRVLRWWHTTMNRFLTLVSNMFSDLAITDMETCYKLFRKEIIVDIASKLKENRFGFEPEVTALVAGLVRSKGIRVAEFPISYRPRTFMEGKKIGWRDGIRALWCITKYNAPTMPIVVQILIYSIGLVGVLVILNVLFGFLHWMSVVKGC